MRPTQKRLLAHFSAGYDTTGGPLTSDIINSASAQAMLYLRRILWRNFGDVAAMLATRGV